MALSSSGNCGKWRIDVVVRIALGLVAGIASGVGARADDSPTFNRDIRPILSGNCFHCHGADEQHREADLRLDDRDAAIADRGGYAAISIGDASASEIIRRIESDDPDLRMPPPKGGKQITPAQVAVLKRWIDGGAKYQTHWAFTPPIATKLSLDNSSPIDHFIVAELTAHGLARSPRAGKATLLRRVTLDLTGLPPTVTELDEFLADDSPNAYERVVDRLLASTASAERLTQDWLDVARYADTNGFSIDDHRDMWVWRDWVIRAFRENKPYDDFIVEQVAGDLLPNATDLQRIATGFLRNGMNTHEGGTIPEEYRMIYTVDKVDTVATAFLGLTMKCAQCHDHKYDPITQRDFYRFYAFFDRSSEPGNGATNGNTPPAIGVDPPLFGIDEWHERLRLREAELVAALAEPAAAVGDSPAPPYDPVAAYKNSIEQELAIVRKQLEADKTNVMVMDNGAANRVTHLRIRGAYDQLGEVLEPGVPEFLASKSQANNRLDLAQWIVDGSNPLAARVAVNRYWQMLFGEGLVETSEDFGTQGAWPSHPELLDWLSHDFVASGWDLRRLLRQIVLSETYCQSSNTTPALRMADPNNRLLARMSRQRLSAESVRDNALAISGLLNRAIGGPSVYPLQPNGLWKEVSHFGHPTVFTAQAYYPSLGESLNRKSMYTFFKRSSPPPMLATFDAPNRETCTVRRLETNTPLQSLVLLNDPQFFAAARAFANRIIDEAPDDSVAERLSYAFRVALARQPTDEEQRVFAVRLKKLTRQASEAPLAQQFVSQSPSPAFGSDERELWAWTIVASTILNLDEVITRN